MESTTRKLFLSHSIEAPNGPEWVLKEQLARSFCFYFVPLVATRRQHQPETNINDENLLVCGSAHAEP